jgi:glycosyltransferase involved in cell wall biosynthesis
MKTLRIVSCPQPSVNPYFALYYGALARFGVEVEYVRTVMQAPIVGPDGPLFDAVHFHWTVERNWRCFGRRAIPQLYGLARWERFLRRTRKAGVKILWTVHELAPPEFGTWIDSVGYRLCAGAADLCICHSEVCRNELIDRYGVEDRKTIAIPIGTYDGVLVPTQSRNETRRQWSLPNDRRLLLCFGFQRPRKGLEIALEAMQSLGADYHLVIQASTSSSKLTRWLAGVQEQYRALPNVTFLHEEIDDNALANLLVAADCVILPYLEIVGSAALSACVTLGCGVVVSDLPYFRESLAADPEVGVFFPPGDAPGLADAVRSYFSVDISRRQAAARRLADRLRWSDLVTPIGEWLRANCANETFDLRGAEADVRRGLTRA